MASTLVANALTTLGEAKKFVKIPISETSQDDLMRTIINLASDRIQTFCNRKFIEETHTEFRDGNRTRRILLNQWPVQSITSLHIDGRREFGASSLVDATNYAIDEDESSDGVGVILFDRFFARGHRNIKIVYVAGYESPSTSELALPSDIQGACLYLVQYYFLHQQQEDIHQASKSKGDETVGINLDIPPFVQAMVEDRRRNEFLGFDSPTRNF